MDDWLTEIKYVGGNILKTHSKKQDRTSEWEGKIMMMLDIPQYGNGIYQYKEIPDCGVHQIQVNEENGSIYVFGTNTSHGKNYQFSYQWIRYEKQEREEREENFNVNE